MLLPFRIQISNTKSIQITDERINSNKLLRNKKKHRKQNIKLHPKDPSKRNNSITIAIFPIKKLKKKHFSLVDLTI